VVESWGNSPVENLHHLPVGFGERGHPSWLVARLRENVTELHHLPRRVRVFSRRGNDYTERVPRIVDTLARLSASSVTLDGEGVDCDPNAFASRRS
jgi:hypothetical protein